MNKSTIRLLIDVVKNGMYEIDIDNGVVYNKKTGHKKKTYKNQAGLDCVGLQIPGSHYYDKSGKLRCKTRCFQMNEIVAFIGGLFRGIHDTHKWNICFLDRDKNNNSISNLCLEHKSTAAKSGARRIGTRG